MDRAAYLHRVDHRGVNPLVYWIVRAVLQPFFHVYFRLSRIGREHIPADGPVILAANHRSFIDPFLIATMVRRPIYYVAKQELFRRRLWGWILNHLGAFPVVRGVGDAEAMGAARRILERGDCVLIFPEGTRTRPGPLGAPRRGVGRLALETGAPVVPVAVIGTQAIRRGWRIRPHKVRIRAGRPLTFPRVGAPSPQLAGAVTERIWPCVALQWEWLGGIAPLRRATVVGAGSWGTALAVVLVRAGVDVELACRTERQAGALAAQRRNDRYLPGAVLPPAVRPVTAERADVDRTDLVVLAMPSRELPAALAVHGERIPARAGVLVAANGLVGHASPAAAHLPVIGRPVGGEAPTDYVAAHTAARAVACLGGPGHAADVLVHGASLVVATRDAALGHQVRDALRAAGLDVEVDGDVIGVELAGAGKDAAALAAAVAARRGPNAAGAAAGKVLAEVGALAARRGGDAASFIGLAGAGDLVATVLADGSPNRRAGELLAGGLPADRVDEELGQEAEALHSVPLLAAAARDAGVRAPALDGLARLVEGELEPERWMEAITAPRTKETRAA